LGFFPTGFRLAIYADLCGGHGAHEPAPELRDEELVRPLVRLLGEGHVKRLVDSL
jgi:hypothetical protein